MGRRNKTVCEHGKPFPRYLNCPRCRDAIDREEREADAFAVKMMRAITKKGDTQ